MSNRSFQRTSIVMEDHKRIPAYTITCHVCGRTEKISANTYGGSMAPEGIANRFRNMGWIVGKNERGDRCPEHAKKTPTAMEEALKPFTKQETIAPVVQIRPPQPLVGKARILPDLTQEENRMRLTPHENKTPQTAAAPAEKPRKEKVSMSAKDRHEISKFIEAVGKTEGEFFTYMDGYDDKRVMREMSEKIGRQLTYNQVYNLRARVFGKLKIDETDTNSVGGMQAVWRRFKLLEARIAYLERELGVKGEDAK